MRYSQCAATLPGPHTAAHRLRVALAEIEVPPDHHRKLAGGVGRILRAQSITDKGAVWTAGGRTSSGNGSGWLEGRLRNAPRTARAPWRTAHKNPSAGSTSPHHGLRWFDTFGAAACARARIRRGAFNKAARGRLTSLWTRVRLFCSGGVELSKSCLFPLPYPPLTITSARSLMGFR